MKLIKAHKDVLLTWIAEGLQSDEINERAAIFKPAFEVSRAQVDYYRKSRAVDIDAIKRDDEKNALHTGLALKSERVKKLKALAAVLEKDLLERGLLWMEKVKGVGAGAIAEIVKYKEFNRSELDAYRGLLDDIAKELGHRNSAQVDEPEFIGPTKFREIIVELPLESDHWMRDYPKPEPK